MFLGTVIKVIMCQSVGPINGLFYSDQETAGGEGEGVNNWSVKTVGPSFSRPSDAH